MRAARIGWLLVAACYNPQVVAGEPCPSGACPVELVCEPSTQTCEFPRDAGPPPDGPRITDSNTDSSSGGGDGGADASTGSACLGTGIVVECFAQLPTGLLTIAAPIDTDTDPSCIAMGSACVIAAGSIEVSQSARASGSRPLVLVAAASITVAAGVALDASSHIGSDVGAGAAGNACPAGKLAAPDEFGGGAGGSFGTTGGNGGTAGEPGTGGTAGATSPATSLRGGCPGQSGSSATGGGAGGGAVYLIAGTAISISGTIDASGAGAPVVGSFLTGAAAGGAGGLIGLDAPTIKVNAGGQVFANGGGGAGASVDGGGGGDPGADPSSALAPAAGGSGASLDGTGGGSGGQGAAGNSTSGGNGDSGSLGCGAGGGGGGGLGVILVWGVFDNSGACSPAPTTH